MSIKFICLKCQREYKNPSEFFECVESHSLLRQPPFTPAAPKRQSEGKASPRRQLA